MEARTGVQRTARNRHGSQSRGDVDVRARLQEILCEQLSKLVIGHALTVWGQNLDVSSKYEDIA